MRRWLATAGLLFGLSMPCWNGAVAMEDLSVEDASAIRAVVQSQLEALMEDDAHRAFELATSTARTQVGTPDDFLRLIKEQYTPIYRHQVVIFSEPTRFRGDAVQLVRLTDGSSHVWVAVFWMKQDEDRSWKVDGCQLLETASVSI